MTLVDTSVWTDYFNGSSSRETEILHEMLSTEHILIGDLILLELLQGFRTDKEFKQAQALLDTLEKRSLLDSHSAIAYADMYRTLRKKGITIRKTADTIIAGYCILNELLLLQSDRDFHPFKKHFGLKLV